MGDLSLHVLVSMFVAFFISHFNWSNVIAHHPFGFYFSSGHLFWIFSLNFLHIYLPSERCVLMLTNHFPVKLFGSFVLSWSPSHVWFAHIFIDFVSGLWITEWKQVTSNNMGRTQGHYTNSNKSASKGQIWQDFVHM